MGAQLIRYRSTDSQLSGDSNLDCWKMEFQWCVINMSQHFSEQHQRCSDYWSLNNNLFLIVTSHCCSEQKEMKTAPRPSTPLNSSQPPATQLASLCPADAQRQHFSLETVCCCVMRSCQTSARRQVEAQAWQSLRLNTDESFKADQGSLRPVLVHVSFSSSWAVALRESTTRMNVCQSCSKNMKLIYVGTHALFNPLRN